MLEKNPADSWFKCTHRHTFPIHIPLCLLKAAKTDCSVHQYKKIKINIYELCLTPIYLPLFTQDCLKEKIIFCAKNGILKNFGEL